jgi:hypothetical protein
MKWSLTYTVWTSGNVEDRRQEHEQHTELEGVTTDQAAIENTQRLLKKLASRGVVVAEHKLLRTDSDGRTFPVTTFPLRSRNKFLPQRDSRRYAAR